MLTVQASDAMTDVLLATRSPENVSTVVETAGVERALDSVQEALLNLLEDVQEEKGHIAENQRALINILEDTGTERARTEAMQEAILNILEDAHDERNVKGQAQTALMNILDDLDAENGRVESVNHELARSNGDLEQYAYIISHDLSEPLRAISGPIALLFRRYSDSFDDDARQLFEFALDGCERMQRMIEGLLMYSRVGRVEEDRVPVDLAVLVARVVTELSSTAEGSGAEIKVGPLPIVTGVPLQLGQVFQNLISNAVKFVPDSTAPRIDVSATRTGTSWRFEVSDNGIGIEPRHRDRIWGMFKRLHTREAFPGTGVGLAIAKKIVERHGGTVGVGATAAGTGSVFWFTLPCPAGGEP